MSGCDSHPFCPALGALLLNVLDSFCLNLGGAALVPAPAEAFILESSDHKDRQMFVTHHKCWRIPPHSVVSQASYRIDMSVKRVHMRPECF